MLNDSRWGISEPHLLINLIHLMLLLSLVCETAANVDMDALRMLSREELRDLFPGPDHFLRRKSIWDLCHPVVSKVYF